MDEKQDQLIPFRDRIDEALRVKGGVKNKQSFVDLAYAIADEVERRFGARFTEFTAYVPEPWVDQLEAHLSEQLDEKLGSAREKMHKAPPARRTIKGSRKLAVPRMKLQGTCDSELFELFEEDRKVKGLNVSQMLDYVLYNFYGQPNLGATEGRQGKLSEGSKGSTNRRALSAEEIHALQKKSTLDTLMGKRSKPEDSASD